MIKRIPEEKLYRICSLTYRLVLGAFIILSIVGRILLTSGDVGDDLSNIIILFVIICSLLLKGLIKDKI